jgi:hypothetical protein
MVRTSDQTVVGSNPAGGANGWTNRAAYVPHMSRHLREELNQIIQMHSIRCINNMATKITG